ncbi:hypothetical protein BLSTO_04877 [Blastocystis sp. subtype 1]
MEVEAICDNCSNKNLQLLGANKEFFLAKCDHVFCGECVKKFIENNTHFLCPKCGKAVRQQDLLKETKEVHEMKKIKDARKEVFSALNAIVPDYSSKEAKHYNLMREDYLIQVINGNREEFNRKVSQSQDMDRWLMGKNAAKQNDYVNKLMRLIDEEKKKKKRMNEEYEKKRHGKKGVLTETVVKDYKNLFYDYILLHCTCCFHNG